MRVLALDTARRTGWAYGEFEGPRLFGAFELPQTGERIAPYLIMFEKYVHDLIATHRPQKIAFESPLLNPRRDNVVKNRKLYGLVNSIEVIAHKMDIPCVEESIGRIRTHFLGKGFPRKSDAVNIAIKVRCRELGWDVPHNYTDEASALALLDYILSLEKPALAVNAKPLFQRVK